MGIPYNVFELKDNLNNKLDPGTLKDGTGTLNYYDKSNNLYLLETYNNGIKNGLSERHYPSSGKISERGTFTNGKKNNDWEYLKTDGSKEKTIIFNNGNVTTDTTKKVYNADFVTMFAENTPEPQGGNDELQSYIESNISYFNFNSNSYYNPEDYNTSKIKMVKSIHFAVSATGKIYHMEFDIGFPKDQRDNIKKAFSAMPPWVPAFDQGFPVEYYYFMPIQLTN